MLSPAGKPAVAVVTRCQLSPPSVLLYIPLVGPPSSKFQALRVRYQALAYNSAGFSGLISISTTPVLLSMNRVCFQVLPPSVVLYMPRSLLGEYKCPCTATQAVLLSVGCNNILPIWCDSGKPRYCQVLPLLVLL